MANDAKKPPIGKGARFKNLVSQLSRKPGASNPARLAGFLGNKAKKK